MATSGTVTFNLSTRQVCTYALRKLRIIGGSETPQASDIDVAIEELNLMLKGWQLSGPNLWRQTFGTRALVAATASYALSPVPFRVVEMRFRNAGGNDLPLCEMTRQDYVDLPQKTSAGTPNQYYVDYQRAGATVYVWPAPAAVTTETLEYTYQRRFDDITSRQDDIDIPQEYLDVVGYNLADRLQDQFGTDDKRITARAAQLMAIADAADREATVRFVPDFSY